MVTRCNSMAPVMRVVPFPLILTFSLGEKGQQAEVFWLLGLRSSGFSGGVIE
jgi:hypothetical protein